MQVSRLLAWKAGNDRGDGCGWQKALILTFVQVRQWFSDTLFWTTTLVHLLFTKENGSKFKILTKSSCFATKTICRRPSSKPTWKSSNWDYKYSQIIDIDDVSCYILLWRRDLVGKKQNVARAVYWRYEQWGSRGCGSEVVAGMDLNISNCCTVSVRMSQSSTRTLRAKRLKQKSIATLQLIK